MLSIYDECKFPVTANKTLSEKTAIFMLLLLIPMIGVPANSGETILSEKDM